MEQVAVHDLDGESGSRGVFARDLERIGRCVDRRDARPRRFVGDRERDRPASGADVEDARLGDPVDPRQAALDHDLRLGPRNENPGIDAQREPPKSPLAEHVRERLAKLTAHDQSIELLQ